ncbi:MAG TPA: ATP-dependent Clp protease adaptor ClpS [Dinghuibacter sp.]|uniref:ATP-dependent Clp protease adaptor ClpS n=1 Tax=Dinghuibacter sp. TaxID=2024697 RepID=UPI002D12BECB|nr:ATP-dependent Clp protease adaptor ClpS [Dinghuibacter sp.]HTJ12130.1 ATP-dependent Clp protease adaptor ClpS [Dinghuibacter sp.]
MPASRPWELEERDTDVMEEHPWSLIVWNDEVNTFEWVIETLIEVCGHSQEQAEQCAMLIHYQGKYAVKNGSYEDLEPMCTAITDRGIGATIEASVPH